MFIAILFLIAKKKKKKTITQWQEKGQIMIHPYNSINKELKSHKINMDKSKKYKVEWGKKEVKEHKRPNTIY